MKRCVSAGQTQEERADYRLGAEKYYDDVFRYRFARQFVGPADVVLDIASGTGYGTEMLASAAKFCVGLDASLDALRVAKGSFAVGNSGFLQADAGARLPFRRDVFDRIVSIETFEHLSEADGERLLAELHRVLKPGGTLVISTPNNPTGSRFNSPNPYHLREYSPDEFVALISDHFSEFRMFGQKSTTSKAIERHRVLARVFFSSWRDRVPGPVRRLVGRFVKPAAENKADMHMEEDNWRQSYVMVAVCTKG